jgi:hypothetical protein
MITEKDAVGLPDEADSTYVNETDTNVCPVMD